MVKSQRTSPNFRVEDPLKYISLFNWVPNWFEIYFFNKVSDSFLAGLFLIILIIYITFYPSPKKK